MQRNIKLKNWHVLIPGLFHLSFLDFYLDILYVCSMYLEFHWAASLLRLVTSSSLFSTSGITVVMPTLASRELKILATWEALLAAFSRSLCSFSEFSFVVRAERRPSTWVRWSVCRLCFLDCNTRRASISGKLSVFTDSTWNQMLHWGLHSTFYNLSKNLYTPRPLLILKYTVER